MKICENFSGNSLKEDLSIDTTFDPSYFSWDSPFNQMYLNLWKKYSKKLRYMYGNIRSMTHRA